MAVIVPSPPAFDLQNAPRSLDLAPSASNSLGPLANAITHGLDLDVVAAVVGLPASDAPLPPPEYRLVPSHKRKSSDDFSDNDTDDDGTPVPFGHVAKRPKQDEIEQTDYVAPTAIQEERLNVTVQEALAAIFSLPTIQAHVSQPFLPEASSLVPPEDPAPAPQQPQQQQQQEATFLFPQDSLETDDDEIPYTQFRNSPPRETRARARMPSLW
ncbi:hypothetical protein EIP91_011348, partial [Steccherinum ochraceum]